MNFFRRNRYSAVIEEEKEEERLILAKTDLAKNEAGFLGEEVRKFSQT